MAEPQNCLSLLLFFSTWNIHDFGGSTRKIQECFLFFGAIFNPRNYQIEHHCWPDLSMLSYQKGQAQLKEICARHGVPYVQENVFIRLKKTLDIAMGKTKMRRYPDSMEREADMMVWQDQKVGA